MTFLEFYLHPMDSSILPPGTIGLLFITIYDPPGQSFVNFFIVDRQNPLCIVFAIPKTSNTAAISSSSIFTELNQLSAKYVTFDVSCPRPSVAIDSLFMNAEVPQIYF